MPPKPKVTKQQILEGAVALVREKGAGALTAKALAARLGCSTQPIFWQYAGMDELRQEVMRESLALFGEYLRRENAGVSAYLSVGLNYIRFAREEKYLFRGLFMGEFGQTGLFGAKVEMEYVLRVIEKNDRITGERAQVIYKDMWLFSHGIAAMIAAGTAEFEEGELRKMLTDVYRGLARYLEDENKTEKE